MGGKRPRRILLVFGTRPEAIKLAPVIRAMAADPALEPVICVTGQHRDMLDPVLRLFAIRPQHDLAIMRPGQDLTHVTTAVLQGLQQVLAAIRPDAVLVQGDTTSALAGALAARYARIPVAHVEAGLRSGNREAPWPEEMNRRLIAGMAALHFAPTAGARDNLLQEGIAPASIAVTGNTGIDALQQALALLDEGAAPAEGADWPRLEAGRPLLLLTGHRRESLDGGLQEVAAGVRQLADEGIAVAYPVHANPRVQAIAWQQLGNHPRIHLLPPLDYLPFVALMRRADLIVTDSGGVQEEAPSLGKPVLVTRAETDRPEALSTGMVELVGTDSARLVSHARRLLAQPRRRRWPANPYGDGRAAGRIAAALRHG